MGTVPTSDEQLRAQVQKRYAKTALQVLGAEQVSTADACCMTTCCTPGAIGDTHAKTIAQNPSQRSSRQPVADQVVVAPGMEVL